MQETRPAAPETRYDKLPRRARRGLAVAAILRSLLVGGSVLVLYFVLPLTGRVTAAMVANP